MLWKGVCSPNGPEAVHTYGTSPFLPRNTPYTPLISKTPSASSCLLRKADSPSGEPAGSAGTGHCYVTGVPSGPWSSGEDPESVAVVSWVGGGLSDFPVTPPEGSGRTRGFFHCTNGRGARGRSGSPVKPAGAEQACALSVKCTFPSRQWSGRDLGTKRSSPGPSRRKYPRGRTPLLRREMATQPSSGAGFENNKAKGNPHGWPGARLLNCSFSSIKTRLEPGTGSQGGWC